MAVGTATVGCAGDDWETPPAILTAPPRPISSTVVLDSKPEATPTVLNLEPVEVVAPYLAPAPTAMVAAQIPTPPALPPDKPQAIVVVVGQLGDAEVRALLSATGWEGAILEEAVRVFCGYGNSRFPSGESRCIPSAIGDRGNSLGLAQLNGATWAPYCGVTQAALFDAETNLRCARAVYQYDLDRGHAPWTQWSIKP